MEQIKLEEVKTKIVTPLGDFNCQSFPIDECNKYEITDEELEGLRNKTLKWDYLADTTIEEDVFEEVIDEDTKEPVKVKKGTIQKTIKHPILVAYDNSKEVEKANARKEIAELKQLLKDTDFKAIKYFEGWYTDEEYEPIKKERQSYRDKINALEVLLNEE